MAQPKVGMSGAEFREALAVSALTHRKTYLLVWHSENGKAIAGGSFLQCQRPGFNPWIGKIPWEGNGYLLQYSCLENPLDRGAWQTTAHGVRKSQT